MQLDDYTRRGALRRWMMLDGQPRCPFDALDVYRLTPAEAAAVLAGNAAVREAVAAVEALEAAHRIRSGEEPPETLADVDGEGEPVEVPNPAHAAWAAAGDTIAEASAETLALHQVRNGPQDEEAARAPDVVPPDPYEDRYPTGPVPEAISDRQFVAALKSIGLVTHAEALAFVRTGDLPAALSEAIAELPDEDEREEAELLVSGAYEFRRPSPLVSAFAAGLGWTQRQVDDLWRSASAL